MTFQIQENDVAIVQYGEPIEKENGTVREVTFEVNGKQFTRDILMSEDEEDAYYSNDTDFYNHNQEAIEKNLIDFFSANQAYYNR